MTFIPCAFAVRIARTSDSSEGVRSGSGATTDESSPGWYHVAISATAFAPEARTSRSDVGVSNPAYWSCQYAVRTNPRSHEAGTTAARASPAPANAKTVKKAASGRTRAARSQNRRLDGP